MSLEAQVLQVCEMLDRSPDSLSSPEIRQILRLLSEGKTVKEVAFIMRRRNVALTEELDDSLEPDHEPDDVGPAPGR